MLLNLYFLIINMSRLTPSEIELIERVQKLDVQKGILEDFRSKERDALYFKKNYQTFRKLYPDMFVAVYERKVVATHQNPIELGKILQERGCQNAYVDRVYRGERPILILTLDTA